MYNDSARRGSVGSDTDTHIHRHTRSHTKSHSNNDAPQTPLESFAFELLSSPLLIQALAEGSLEDPFPAFRKVLARISIAEVSGPLFTEWRVHYFWAHLLHSYLPFSLPPRKSLS